MTDTYFDKLEITEVNGEIQAILHLNLSNDTEFSEELGALGNGNKETIKESALKFIKKKKPMLKVATIVIVAGAVIISSFPLQKAKAHEVDFNMSYLYFGNTQSYISQIDRTQGNLNVVSPSYFDINADGSLRITTQFDPVFVKEMHKRGIKVVPFLSNHWDRNVGRAALENRELLSLQIANFIINNDLDGVQVDVENVTDIDRDNYTELVKLINEKLPAEKEVSVAVAANPNGWTKGWHGSYNYTELAKYSDYLMIMAYDESYTGGPEGPVASYGWVERSIQYTLNQGVPPEKVVLGIPFYGRYWKEGATTGGDGISNWRVDEMLTKYGGQVTFDEVSKSPKAIITIKEGAPTTTIAGKTLGPGTYHIWYENHESIKAKLQLIHKYHLKGSGSWSLGQENSSIWQDYRSWISHDGNLTVTPTVPEQPKEQTGVVEPTKPTTHTVISGDSLWKIATQYHLTVDQLKQYNKLTSDVVWIGQVLSLDPSVTTTQPVSGVTNPSVSTPGAISTPTPKPVPKVTTPAKPPPSLVGKYMVPKASKTYLRSGATSKNKVLKSLTTRDTVKVIQEYTDKSKVKWLKIQSGSITGWVLASQLNIKPVTPAPVVKKYPTLKYGSKGSAVIDMQNKLKKAGIYKGKIHGTYDTATRSSVVALQKKYKLKADGIAGPTTLSKLDAITKGK